MRSVYEFFLASECLADFHRASEAPEFFEVENSGVVQIDEVRGGVFIEKGLEHIVSKACVFIQIPLLLHVVGPLAPRERFLVVGDVADEIEVAHLFLT